MSTLLEKGIAQKWGKGKSSQFSQLFKYLSS